MTPGIGSGMQPQNPYVLDAVNEIEVPHQFTDSISDIKMKSIPNT